MDPVGYTPMMDEPRQAMDKSGSMTTPPTAGAVPPKGDAPPPMASHTLMSWPYNEDDAPRDQPPRLAMPEGGRPAPMHAHTLVSWPFNQE
eukprot:CAMPEP_0174827520 /NCGR_PEP_ID=MMETSP1114-20130205/773_1 /TAXON_ID=312471 /ORGANISM="Neobodo designis, Strain CCAP 1951/1" /LENGTH=89 /DNA_ID=CAMNT_0016061179 /DNA_START=153 /DNA_END=422 /DNA_ORIENTATION=+